MFENAAMGGETPANAAGLVAGTAQSSSRLRRVRAAASRWPSESSAMDFDLDPEKRFPYEIVAKLGELGLMGIPFPEEYGGAGADSLAYAIAVEELTRVD